MNGQLFLGTAHLLLLKGEDEAAYRSAVSRAYYACYITTRDLALKTCSRRSRAKVGPKILHTNLPIYLKNGLNDDVKRLGQALSSLYGMRLRADYKMVEHISKTRAKQVVVDADFFINELYRIPEEEIGRAMDAYIELGHD